MEFHNVFEVFGFFRRIDGSFQKPLKRVIPNIDELFANPTTYFQNRRVVINPRKRWASAAGLGVAFFVVFVVLGEILARTFLAKGMPGRPPAPPWLVLTVLAAPIIGFWLGLLFLRGARCILNGEGACFVRDNTEVFVPWSVFSAPGQPIVHPVDGRDCLELPINQNAVHLVQAKRDTLVFARGLAVAAKQLRIRSNNDAVIQNLYQVKPEQLGILLLDLGSKLAKPAPAWVPPVLQTESPVSAVPRAGWEKDGWLTVSLTTLNFPPECCNCGIATTDTRWFRTGNGLRRDTLDLFVPLCRPCNRQFSRRCLKEFSKFGFLVAALGFGVGYFVGGFLDPAAGNRTFSVMAITWAILVGLFSLSILWLFREWIVGRCSPPIQFRQYRASEGTVALRFRRNEYAELLLSSLRDKGTLKVSE